MQFCWFLLMAALGAVWSGQSMAVTLASGWAYVSGGHSGGIAYGSYTDLPDAHPNRGQGLFKVWVELNEHQEAGALTRSLALSWFPVVKPEDEPASYPYRWWVEYGPERRRNVALEELSFATSPSLTTNLPVVRERWRDGAYDRYRAQAFDRGRSWQLVLYDQSRWADGAGWRLELDSNQPGEGFWSERSALLHEESFEIQGLRAEVAAEMFQVVAASELNHAQAAWLQEIRAAYPPVSNPLQLQQDHPIEERLQTDTASDFFGNEVWQKLKMNSGLILDHFPEAEEVAAHRVVVDRAGHVIATLTTLLQSTDEGYVCSKDVLKAFEPDDQTRTAYWELGRGACI